jgi:hypothetical protein
MANSRPFRQIAPGVLSIVAREPAECAAIISAAEGGLWTQADIANYDDKKMLAAYANLEARNVQVQGAAIIPALCADYVQLLETLGQPIILEKWGVRGLRASGPKLAKYIAGSHIRAHNDTPTEFSERCVSALLYLNDEYSGGELLFPRLELAYRASVGELILFPSEYLHAVAPVTAGTRYCFVAFFVSEAFREWPARLAAP